MTATIEIQCRVQYLRKGKWVTINKEDGIVATIESDLVEEVERLKKVATKILYWYKEESLEHYHEPADFDAIYDKVEAWKNEIDNPHDAEKEG